MIDLNKIKQLYFVGIGGIGISAVAGIMQKQNFLVQGSDGAETEIVANLRSRGIMVDVPHLAKHITAEIDLVCYSVAVPIDNPERLRAKELGIPELSYPELLGLLIKEKWGIGISGTDGKTTTTAMLAKILIEAQFDPTVVLGSKAKFLEDNWRMGESKYFVFESDEYRRAFVNYNPQIAVITNIGLDHLDYYKNQDDYLEAFSSYLKRIPQAGFIIINNDDDNSIAVALKCQAKLVTFGINNPADFRVKEIKIEAGCQKFMVMERGSIGSLITLPLPGQYNVANALAAIATARQLGVEWQVISAALADFGGLWRRFEKLGYCDQALVIADYAHTPDAVAKAIRATNDFYKNKKVLTVFQPHQYARTKKLFSNFVEAFSEAQKVLLPDIFYVAGRENPADYDVSSQKLAEAIGAKGIDILATGDLLASEEKIRLLADKYDVILLLGAGNIYEVAKKLVQ